MKINSHAAGITIGVVLIAGWMWYTDKEVEKFMDYTIFKRRGKYVAEYLTGDRDKNPEFNTLEEVKVWIGAQVAASSVSSIAAMIPGIGDVNDVLLLPPSGRTVSKSGQVLGNLGERIDVYDAAPQQYRSDVINDMMPGFDGWGSKIKKSVSKAVSAVTKPVEKVTAKVANLPAVKVLSVINPIAASARLAAATTRIVAKGITNPKGAFKLIGGAVKSFTITPLMQAGMVIGVVKKPTQTVDPSVGVVYQDANGNTISKEEYDQQMAAASGSTPVLSTNYKGYSLWTMVKPGGGVIYLINYDVSQNAAEGAYNTMTEAEAAIDAVSIPVPILAQNYKNHTIWSQTQSSGGVVYLIDYDPSVAYTGASFPTMTAAQAAIDATIPAPTPPPSGPAYVPPPPLPSIQAPSQPSSYDASNDRLGPVIEDDYGSGSGTPALPEKITLVSTPSAQFAPPPASPSFAPPPATAPVKSGNATVGVVVGGGILAALAAFTMNK